MDYKLAKLHRTQQGYFVEYAVYYAGKWHRKRIWLNSVPYKYRRTYANKIIRDINLKLLSGWSPFAEENNKSITLIDAIDLYFKTKQKELRQASIRTYQFYIKLIFKWLKKNKIKPITITDFSEKHAAQMIQYINIHQNWSEAHFNRFLLFCKTLWNWFVEFRYTDINVFARFRKKKERKKIRRMFSDDELQQYFHFLQNDKWFLFYSYLTFYCFIRPKEITMLRFYDFNLQAKTVLLRSEISKNGKRQVVTLPVKVTELAEKLNFSKYKNDWFIYSNEHKPGNNYRDPRYIAKKFARIRQKLEFDKELQFYSLKDTGIVKMLRAGVSPNIVRDQARHYSLEITNRYIQLANEGAFEEVLNKVNY